MREGVAHSAGVASKRHFRFDDPKPCAKPYDIRLMYFRLSFVMFCPRLEKSCQLCSSEVAFLPVVSPIALATTESS